MKVVIVGGVAGGASAAARLRRLSENTEIIILEKGPYISYANCGLPYHIGGTIKERSALLLQTPESFKSRFNVDVRVNNEVLSIDTKSKKVLVKGNVEYEESYDKLLLAVGSKPFIPNIPGSQNCDSIFSLWTVDDTDRIKNFIAEKNVKNAVVVGGGFIGLEMVENLVDCGIKVTLVEADKQVMAPLDFEMAQIVHKELNSKGVELNLGDGIQSIKKVDNNAVVVLNSGKEIQTELIILSIGVRPQSEIAKKAGLRLNERGGIIVNKYLQTSDKNIFAVGDAIEVTDFITKGKTMIPLAGPANKQGRIVASSLLGEKNDGYNGTQGTAIAKVFDLQIASTGLNEKRLIKSGKKIGKDYEVVIVHPRSHASYYPNALLLSLKLLFDKKSKKIFGAQIVGFDGCDKRIDVISTVMRLNGTVIDLTKLELAYAPPFSSAKDPVNMVGFQAENIINGLTKVITYDKIDTIKNATILDVREKSEVLAGAISGSINIRVDSIREEYKKLDKTKPIIVYCAVGFRGYIAARILNQLGFKNVYNLAGGWTTYKYTLMNFEKKCSNTQSMKIENIRTIDCCGLSCPGPIQKTLEEFNNLKTGEVLEITSNDPGFALDIDSWCKKSGNILVSSKSDKGKVVVIIKKS